MLLRPVLLPVLRQPVNPLASAVRNLLAELLGSSNLFAPLTHSLALERGTGSPTFTRATTGTVQDNEGILRTAIAGEARFTGARRVYNQVSASENLAAWTQTNCTYTKNLTGPDGVANSAGTLTATGANALFYKTLPVIAGRTVFSVQVKRLAGTGSIFISNDGANTFTDVTSQVSSGWIRVSSAQTLAVANFPVIKIATSGDSIGVGQWQFEDITGRTDQTTPSEYVSVGVLSAPYHGAGVDGVKYFDTDLSGNPIAASTLKGYLAEPAATNLCLQSQDLATTWTNNNTTESVNAAVAPDGTTTADKLVEAATTSTHTIYNTIAGTSGVYTTSVYLKAGERTWAYITEGNSVTATAWFDLANGVVGTVSGTGTPSAKITSIGNGWYRCSMTFTAGANANIQIGCATGDALISYLGDITKGIYAWGAQFETGSSATSYIPTTTTAVARNADNLSYGSAGNIDGTVGWAYAEITYPRTSVANAVRVIHSDASGLNGIPLYLTDTTRKVALYDGTAEREGSALSLPVTTPTKIGSTWGGVASTLALSGATTSAAFDGSMNATAIQIGYYSGLAGNELNGNIKNVRIGQRQLSSSELQAITR